MYLGVDRRDRSESEPTRFQRPLAIVLGIVALIEILVLSQVHRWSIGPVSVQDPTTGTSSHGYAGQLSGPGENIQKLGQAIYTRYLLPFEMTAALLVIAVVAAVVLSRRQLPVASEMSQAEQDEVTAE
jgi:NADH-quinone oxidoreductase subunit J